MGGAAPAAIMPAGRFSARAGWASAPRHRRGDPECRGTAQSAAPRAVTPRAALRGGGAPSRGAGTEEEKAGARGSG